MSNDKNNQTVRSISNEIQSQLFNKPSILNSQNGDDLV